MSSSSSRLLRNSNFHSRVHTCSNNSGLSNIICLISSNFIFLGIFNNLFMYFSSFGFSSAIFIALRLTFCLRICILVFFKHSEFISHLRKFL